MSTDIATRPDVRALVDESAMILTHAKEFRIATNVSYKLAGEELKRIKGAMKRMEELRTAITRPMDAAKRAVMDLFGPPAERLATAERSIKSAMVTYQNEIERQAREERLIAEREAREQQERLEAAASRAAERGEMETADALQSQAATVQPVAVTRETPKIAGINFRDAWKFEITDPAAIPREYLLVDESKIRKIVQAMKADTKIPGVRVYSEKQPASSAA
jgi:hypothetical protein